MGTFRPPAGVTGPTWTTPQVQSQIAIVAANKGVPVPLAEAQAQVESGFNPYDRGDVQNGVPTSFGIYQLHQGAELDSLPGPLSHQIAAAYDPATNARVSLSRLAAVYKADPSADPGAMAAAAQRPADPAGYAAKVDAALAGAGASDGGGAAPPPGMTDVGGTVGGGSGVFGSGTTTYKLTPIGPSITIWSWPRIAFVVFGSLLVLLGLYVTFRGSDSSTIKVQEEGQQPNAAGEAAAAATTESVKRPPVNRRQHAARHVARHAAEAAAEA